MLHQEAGLCVHLRQVYVFFAANDAEEVSNEEQQVQQWRLTPEQAGPVRMLQWGGISRSTPQWPSRWGMLYRGTLHLLENETSIEPLDSLNIWNNRWEPTKQIQVQYCCTASSVMHAGQVFGPLALVHDSTVHKLISVQKVNKQGASIRCEH